MTKCWKEILNLILKPLRRNSEIQECDLNRHLGSEVRVAQLGNEVEPEIWIVLDHGVPDQDAVCKDFYVHWSPVIRSAVLSA